MKYRNIAIIAHVDHGKTTLVDCLLRQTGLVRQNERIEECALDHNEQERERGITILAKCTSVEWCGTRINIVDTPGHADFGGEVERILSMVDGVVLLVDASEGPMPQTKFVLSKALGLGLLPIVLVNKVDKPAARPFEVHNETFDLFVALEANEEQLDFPVLFSSAKEGWVIADLDDDRVDISPFLNLVLDYVPEPSIEENRPFSLLATILDFDAYLGRLLIGRVASGQLTLNAVIKALTIDGVEIESTRITKILVFRGLKKVPVTSVDAGDIIAIAGFQKATVSHTICDLEVNEPLKAEAIDPPTVAMTFSVNDSPLAGREGDKVTSRLIRDRLIREAESNVAINVEETGNQGTLEVSGRGELQLSVLIEEMRREGYELSISKPRVLFRIDTISGKTMEPIEEAVIDVDEEFSGSILEKLGARKGELKELRSSGGGKQRLVIFIPTRSLIGYYGEFMTDTRGTGVLNRIFHGFAPFKGKIYRRREGTIVSRQRGKAVSYALWNLEARGSLFIGPGEEVYSGMVIGEHNKGEDLEVNPLKGKQLTNFRAAGKDEAVDLTPPNRMSLEEAIAYIEDDELVEVTPQSIRLRKRYLDPHKRRRASKQTFI